MDNIKRLDELGLLNILMVGQKHNFTYDRGVRFPRMTMEHLDELVESPIDETTNIFLKKSINKKKIHNFTKIYKKKTKNSNNNEIDKKTSLRPSRGTLFITTDARSHLSVPTLYIDPILFCLVFFIGMSFVVAIPRFRKK